jgi:hypothetical protein
MYPPPHMTCILMYPPPHMTRIHALAITIFPSNKQVYYLAKKHVYCQQICTCSSAGRAPHLAPVHVVEYHVRTTLPNV